MVFCNRSIIGIWNLFVIWCLVFGIFTSVYALNLDSVKVSFVKGDYKEAITEGEKVMAEASGAKGLDELYYILGLCYMKEGNYLRAGDIFEIILREFKQSRFRNEAKLGLADTYFFKGDYERAKKEYENLLHNSDAKKLQALVYQRLSECALKSRDTRSASDYVEMLNNNFPLNIEPKIDLSLWDSEGGGYCVQVGSFSSSTNARNLKRKLENKGYSVFIEDGRSKGKAISRVKVGSFVSRQEAAAAERRLSREGYPTRICP
ncbi:MAG: SPOR domain-containing protein [Candidatus Omnitrophota bacterium]